MANKKRLRHYQMEVTALPPLKMVLGEIPSPKSDQARKPGEKTAKLDPEMESAIQRLIFHLKEK